MQYELISGIHAGPGIQNKVTHYAVGDVVESDEPLDVLFPNKFRLVEETASTKKGAKARKAVAPPEDDDEAADRGDDMTEDFDGAEDAGVRIFREKNKGYFVYRDDGSDSPLNDKPLKRKEVDPFIEDLASEDKADGAEAKEK